MIGWLEWVPNEVSANNPLSTGSRTDRPVDSRAVSDAGARAQIERVISSEGFRNSESSRRLLRYLADESLAGRGRDLKEYTVGIEAFGKPSEYDPRTDASTRVQAGKMRQRLEEYYRTEGAADPVVIRFPKGGFQICFEAREKRGRRWRWPALVAALSVALLALASYIVVERRGRTRAISRNTWTSEMEALWAPILDDSSPVVVAIGMPLFIHVGRGVIIRDYTLNQWPEADQSETVRKLREFYRSSRSSPVYIYTGEGDATAAFLLARLLGARKPELRLKRSNVLDWEDIKNNHVVFLGNQKSQPHLRDILAERDFRVEGNGIRNLRPRAGDAPFYGTRMNQASREIEEEYGLVRRLPGASGRKEVFGLSTYSTEGVWALAEYLTDPPTVKELVGNLRQASGQMPRAWEAILRIRYKAQVPVQIQYVTHHAL